MNKRTKTILIILLVVTLAGGGLTTLTGNKSLKFFQSGDVKTAVRISTMLYIDNDPAKADSVISVMRKTRASVDEHKEITIAKAAEEVRSNIVWNKLEPVEALIAEAAILKIEAALANEIKHAHVSSNKVVIVHNVLDWIKDSAFLVKQLTLKEMSAVDTKEPENL